MASVLVSKEPAITNMLHHSAWCQSGITTDDLIRKRSVIFVRGLSYVYTILQINHSLTKSVHSTDHRVTKIRLDETTDWLLLSIWQRMDCSSVSMTDDDMNRF